MKLFLRLLGFRYVMNTDLTSKIHYIGCSHAKGIKSKKYLTEKKADSLQGIVACQYCIKKNE